MGGGWTPAIKTLIIACVIGFLLQIFDQFSGAPSFYTKFGLVPAEVTEKYYLWQLVTYMFLHGGFFHILFNMFGLYMFGSELEATWGTRQFTKFFFLCGIGGALASVLVSPHSYVLIIGASGAIFGLLVAYGVLFPNRLIYLYMIIPIQAKWFVIIYGAIRHKQRRRLCHSCRRHGCRFRVPERRSFLLRLPGSLRPVAAQPPPAQI